MLEVDLASKRLIAEQLMGHLDLTPDPSSEIDPSENCELCPEDEKALIELRAREKKYSDLFAEIILFDHHIPDPNRTFTPEER
jgi:hypothetical protein